MATCFVIQPFDHGPFDSRYEDIVAPAIQDAGLTPYRVDRDPGANNLIDGIEQGIKASAVCVCDISKDNPNVWYELGFAMAAGKPVVLLSAKGRDRFPFDVQHRNVLVYGTDSTRDFEALRRKLSERLRAEVKKSGDLAALAAPKLRDEGGVAPHEVACLAVIMENTLAFPAVAIQAVLRDMEQAGFNGTAVGIAVRSLAKKHFIEVGNEQGRDGDDYNVYRVTDAGADWLVAHQSELRLTLAEPVVTKQDADEIPF